MDPASPVHFDHCAESGRIRAVLIAETLSADSSAEAALVSDFKPQLVAGDSTTCRCALT